MGPIATAYFYELIIKMTDAETDQEHIEMLIHSKPQVPDRTDYIMGKSMDNPLTDLINMGNTLSSMGADYIAIPCITAHYFQQQLTQGIKAPIINIVKETVSYLNNYDIKQVGIMATEGTIYGKMFQEELTKLGITAYVPSEKQQKNITHIIYKNVKANRPVELDRFMEAAEELKSNGARVIILGCTELSIIKRDYNIGPGFIDAMEVLAMRSIQLCGAKTKDEYKNLIT